MKKIFGRFRSKKTLPPNINYVVNPYTNQPTHELPFHSVEERLTQLEKSRKIFRQFKKTSIPDRINMIEDVLENFMKIVEDLTTSTGKPITQCSEDFNNSLKHARQYINLYTKFSKDRQLVRTSQPHGVSFITNTWRNPFDKSLQFLIPSFLSGNISVLKPSQVCPHIGSFLEETFNENAFEGSVINLILDQENTYDFINKAQIDSLLFQGSHRAGDTFHSHMNLELDVNRRYELDNHTIAIVEEINDEIFLEKAVDIVSEGAFRNTGQGSHSIKNVFVHEDIYEGFKEKLVEKILGFEIGNPLESSVTMGPLCVKDEIINGAKLIEEAVLRGANLIIGGEPQAGADGVMNFFQPTLLEDVDSSMMLYFESFTKLGLPVIILNKYNNLNSVKNFLLSPDAQKGGKKYLDQMLLVSENDNTIDYMKDQFGCARIFYNRKIASELDKHQIMQFFNKEMRIMM